MHKRQLLQMGWKIKTRSCIVFGAGLLRFEFSYSGEGGIRTPGSVTFNSFQDCRNRPLCHLSERKIRVYG